MGLDEEDTPVGEIIALVAIVAITFVIIVITFDSCSDFGYGEAYRYCSDVRFEIQPDIGESKVCYDDDGNAVFNLLNIGEIRIEGVDIDYNDYDVNYTGVVPVLSQKKFLIDLGLRAGVEFSHFNVTPLVFFPDQNKTIVCEQMRQKVSTLERCGLFD
jgi:hypothetical protein